MRHFFTARTAWPPVNYWDLQGNYRVDDWSLSP